MKTSRICINFVKFARAKVVWMRMCFYFFILYDYAVCCNLMALASPK